MTVWLTPVQVAERTGFAVATLRNWRSLGTGPTFRKIGRLVRYEEQAIDAWQSEDH